MLSNTHPAHLHTHTRFCKHEHKRLTRHPKGMKSTPHSSVAARAHMPRSIPSTQIFPQIPELIKVIHIEILFFP